MSALGLRRFSGGLQRRVYVSRRSQSTHTAVLPIPTSKNAVITRTKTTPYPRAIAERPAHTHFLSVPLDNGTFLDRLVQMRSFLRENASIAGLEPCMIIPNIKKTCLFRFGHIIIEGYKTNKKPLPNQKIYKLSQVEKALNIAKMRIDLEINKEHLELEWGSVSPVVPLYHDTEQKAFNPGLVKILGLRTQPNPAWDSMKNIQSIVFEELETAGITDAKLRSSSSLLLTIINTRWGHTVIDGGIQKSKPFNIKTLYTIPGFDQFRTMPLPTYDDALARFIPVNLGKCNISNIVLEEVGSTIGHIDNDPVITKSYNIA